MYTNYKKAYDKDVKVTPKQYIFVITQFNKTLADRIGSIKNNARVTELIEDARKALRNKQGDSAVFILNKHLNEVEIPRLNRVIDIFNEAIANYEGFSSQLERIYKELPRTTGGGNTTRSRRPRSYRNTMKLRFIY